MKDEIFVDEWMRCYPSNWKGVIVEEAMAHPAKFSSRLIRRIYAHLAEEGWVKEGDSVLDPFGGVALGAFDALRMGLTWYGVELEERFFKIGERNIALWDSLYETMPKWGRAKLLQGDSRQLLKVLGGATGITCQVSSPPYAESIQTSEKGSGIDYSKAKNGGKGRTAGREAIATGYGRADGQLGVMKAEGFELALSSPPFLQSDGGTPEPKPGGVIDRALYERHAAGNHKAGGYGRSEGQLHHMKDGGFDTAISSPPFQTDGEGTPLDPEKYPTLRGVLKTNAAGLQKYGDAEGQLANMKGDFDASVSSPPYGNSFDQEPEQREKTIERMLRNGHDISRVGKNYSDTLGYGREQGQLGNESGDDFWLAAREIVEQVYLALTPGGHAVWVVKDYVKNKQVVPFCDQWRQLCEAVGFVTLHEHHAMLVHGRQMTLEGGVHVKESKSFFRRIAEKNGSPRIDYEVVLCMVKTPLPSSPHFCEIGGGE